jgi:hypothetical protein
MMEILYEYKISPYPRPSRLRHAFRPSRRNLINLNATTKIIYSKYLYPLTSFQMKNDTALVLI